MSLGRKDWAAWAAATIGALLVACILLGIWSAVAAHAEGLPDGSTLPPHKTITFHGLCEGWKAWRTREGDLWIVCPGGPEHPAGAVELRAYYVLR